MVGWLVGWLVGLLVCWFSSVGVVVGVVDVGGVGVVGVGVGVGGLIRQ